MRASGLALALISLFCRASSETGTCDDPQANHFELAVDADGRGDFEQSLAHFQAAAKFDPSGFNLANLGVCHMRFAIRGEGRHHLSKALAAVHRAKQSGSSHALDNWHVLLDTCTKMGFEVPSEYLDHQAASPWQRPALTHQRQVPPAPPLPRVALNQIEDPANRLLRDRRVPFVLTGAMAGWKARSWQLEQLAARWPKAVADFHPFNMLDRDSKALYLTRFSAGLNELTAAETSFAADGAGPQGRYLHLQFTPQMWSDIERRGELDPNRHPITQADEWMDACMAAPLQEEYHIKTHWKILIVGTQGAGMFNHTDSLRTSSWHGQLEGRKWWYWRGCSEHRLG